MKKDLQKTPVYRPPPLLAKSCQLFRFLEKYLPEYAHLEKKRAAKNFSSLHHWSLKHPEAFWSALAEFAGIRFSKKPHKVLQTAARFQDAKWFVGAELNFAEHLLSAAVPEDKIAISAWSEKGKEEDISYGELRAWTASLANKLRECGVGRGDVVAGYLPNIPEAIVGMLAATSLGATWTCASPEFSAEGVLARFALGEPKVFLTCSTYYFKNKEYSLLQKIQEIADGLRSVKKIFFVPGRKAQAEIPKTCADIPCACFPGKNESHRNTLCFEQLPADTPVYILYSSGTAGKPKGIIHGAIGTLLEHAKEHLLHLDIGPKDVFFYRATTGWMMWNWQVSALALGCTLVLYDGDLNSDRIFELGEKEQVTVFGTAAGHVQYIKNNKISPKNRWDLSSLRLILSTGSPLWEDLCRYAYEHIAPVHIASISGGTDIVGCFGLGSTALPVYAGEIQVPSLGLAVDVFDEHGQSVRDQVGELVCTAPFPSMPVAFVDDTGGKRYHAAYFEKYENIWAHSDAAIMHTDTGGMEILGRSDDTLNPGGERFGPSVITNVVDKMPGVLASAALAVRRNGEERVVLFIKTDGTVGLDENFRAELKRCLENPRYVPHFILAVSDFPYTLSGKLSTSAIRAVINAGELRNKEALANPEILQEYEDLVQAGIFTWSSTKSA